MQLSRLAYFSTATENMTAVDITKLVKTADVRNRSLDITGILLFNGANFLQVLEGPAPALDVLMASIGRDSRHSGIVVVSNAPIEARAFADWSLHYAKIRRGETEPAVGIPMGLPSELREMLTSVNSMNS